jgi:hypothetical protein
VKSVWVFPERSLVQHQASTPSNATLSRSTKERLALNLKCSGNCAPLDGNQGFRHATYSRLLAAVFCLANSLPAPSKQYWIARSDPYFALYPSWHSGISTPFRRYTMLTIGISAASTSLTVGDSVSSSFGTRIIPSKPHDRWDHVRSEWVYHQV